LVILALLNYRHRLLGITELSPAQVVMAMNHEHAVVIDLRSEADYAAGHIINARHFPAANFLQQIDKLNKSQNKKVILVADLPVLQLVPLVRGLQSKGFAHVATLEGGMAAWVNAQLPVKKS
jgi:rhodanese-related sulfurtransferase